jgi:hypothetical protein
MLYGKETPFKSIESDLAEYIKQTSKNTIIPVWRDGKEDAKFYELEYVYRAVYYLSRSRRI